MANISKFDREEVLEKAKNLFWEKGYLGTSTRELQSAIDMRPGSIYAAFGSKSDLFITVLKHYADALAKQMQAHVFNKADVLGAFKAQIHDLVLSPNQRRPSEICMLAKTLSELDESHSDILTLARSLLEDVESMFTEVFNQAKLQHTVSAQLDVLEAAKVLQVNIIGWRSYLKATGDSDAVERQIEMLFSQFTEQQAH
ncbi:MAG: TetR family transcriptional regulator [Alteromonadaceae bacterium]|uniref:TetR/AcrR family transcriptional regulator n=1 Tax=Paraglaciecola chathamensis TaxID=368405 RepID=UPI000C53030A|nr:TetR/AcrR family transcriptional regulator [Paraglaciecola agarilytica]MBN23926.1 TetR family transcriptional regulator [Alteromonadaceae bacterium]|tara:strand:- start:736 stop:1332 length:597 start_codon:yes stop_codon:yes gene_type:complete